MAADRIIGIDFGTSTSVIRVKRYEAGKPIGEKLEFKEVSFKGMGNTVPTVIQQKIEDPSIEYYGYDAHKPAKTYHTYQNFKMELESDDPLVRAQAREMTEKFLQYLAKEYQSQSEGGFLGEPNDKERTIISYPVKWSEETRQFMIATAQKAGFPNVTGMDEAQAAIQAVTVMSEDHLRKNGLLVNGKPSNILLIDMGAGTTDLVLCRYTPGEKAKAEILSTWPKDGEILFGGREVDSLLQSFFRGMMDEESANLVFRRVGLDKFKTWKENTVSPALRRNDSVTDFEPLDNQIEDNDIDMDEYCLDRAAFEKCLEDYLKQLPRLINGCIDNSKIKASDVDLVILTGGHSQWYFVKEMLAGKMPQYGKLELAKIILDFSRIIPITRPQETVALGMVYGFTEKLMPIPLEEYEDSRRQKRVLPEPPMDLEYTPESEFELASDGENYIIKNYIGSRREIRIPPVIRGRKVVAIGEEAFARYAAKQLNWFDQIKYYYDWECQVEDESRVETIVLPETIYKIGRKAFVMMKKLRTVVAPGVKIIEEGAFRYCDSLQEIKLSRELCEIKVGAFGKCNSLSRIDFGAVRVIPGTVVFPSNLQSIGCDAFSHCPIDEVFLPRGAEVHPNAFYRSNRPAVKCSYYG